MASAKPLPPLTVLQELFTTPDQGRTLIRRTSTSHRTPSGSIVNPVNQEGRQATTRVAGYGQFLVSRITFKLVTGLEPKQNICHQDSDPSNNHIDNLKDDSQRNNCATRSQHSYDIDNEDVRIHPVNSGTGYQGRFWTKEYGDITVYDRDKTKCREKLMKRLHEYLSDPTGFTPVRRVNNNAYPNVYRLKSGKYIGKYKRDGNYIHVGTYSDPYAAHINVIAHKLENDRAFTC